LEEEVIKQRTSGGLSNQKTPSPDEFMSQWTVERNVQNVTRTMLQNNAIVLYLFL
jgi:hypothetical protein